MSAAPAVFSSKQKMICKKPVLTVSRGFGVYLFIFQKQYKNPSLRVHISWLIMLLFRFQAEKIQFTPYTPRLKRA
jgi:hypothetical protein